MVRAVDCSFCKRCGRYGEVTLVCWKKEGGIGEASGASGVSYIMMEEDDANNTPSSYLGSRLATFQMTLARQVDLDPDGGATVASTGTPSPSLNQNSQIQFNLN